MRTRIWAGLVALVSSFAAGGAYASVISYTEGADLSNNSTPTALGALDIGTNTVTGSITVHCGLIDGTNTNTCGFPGDDVADLFSVTLPSGDEVTSLTLNVTSFSSTDPNVLFGVSQITSPHIVRAFTSAGLQTLDSSAIPGPTTFDILASYGVETAGPFPANMSYNYVYTITVEQIPTTSVPEPATLALLGLGLAGLATVRRRKAS